MKIDYCFDLKTLEWYKVPKLKKKFTCNLWLVKLYIASILPERLQGLSIPLFFNTNLPIPILKNSAARPFRPKTGKKINNLTYWSSDWKLSQRGREW